MNAWIARGLTLLFGMVVAAAIVEVGFRIGSDEPWYERLEQEQNRLPRPDRSVGGRSFKVREELPTDPKPPGTFRILFLGDSFTYGSGMADAEDAFPALVDAELRRRLGPDAPLESFNGGIPGSLPDSWIRLLEAARPTFEPDLVVAVFFLRDGTRGIGGTRANITAIGRKLAELSDESWWYRNYHTYRFFREKAAQREFSARYLDAMHEAYFGPEEKTAQWRRSKGELLRLRNMTRERGGRFVLVVFPVLFALEADYPLREVCETIESFGRVNGIPTLSLLPAFLGRDAPSLWVAELDQHPNEEGHRIAAAAIADFLLPIVSEPETISASGS